MNKSGLKTSSAALSDCDMPVFSLNNAQAAVQYRENSLLNHLNVSNGGKKFYIVLLQTRVVLPIRSNESTRSFPGHVLIAAKQA
jgi:hypothetical protein